MRAEQVTWKKEIGIHGSLNSPLSTFAPDWWTILVVSLWTTGEFAKHFSGKTKENTMETAGLPSFPQFPNPLLWMLLDGGTFTHKHRPEGLWMPGELEAGTSWVSDSHPAVWGPSLEKPTVTSHLQTPDLPFESRSALPHCGHNKSQGLSWFGGNPRTIYSFSIRCPSCPDSLWRFSLILPSGPHQ